MVLVSPVPHDFSVVPVSVLKSLSYKDSLQDQRALARALYFQSCDIYRAYFQDGTHPAVTADVAEWALRRTDHTTLRPGRNETPDWMRRMAWEAANPIPMRSVCTWADIDKVEPLIDFFKDHPQIGITVVLNYPHGWDSPDHAAREIDRWGEVFKDVKNPIDVDTVIHYLAWMAGKKDLVDAILEAEGAACRRHNFTWKSIQMVSVHAYAAKNKTYGDDYFHSVYDSSILAMSHGANPKTSTGQAAAPPFNDFVAKDTGFLGRYLPMLLAIRDFNATNGERRWPKFSGGNESEVDAAVCQQNCQALIPEVLDNVAFGTSYRFRTQLLRFIRAERGDDCGFGPDIFLPFGIDAAQLPPHKIGILGADGKPAGAHPALKPS